jgi:hypothetical protein
MDDLLNTGSFADSLRDRRAALEKQLPESEETIRGLLTPEAGFAPSQRRSYLDVLGSRSREALSSDIGNIATLMQLQESLRPEEPEEPDIPSFTDQLKAMESGLEFRLDPKTGGYSLMPAQGMEGIDPSLRGKTTGDIRKARLQLQSAEAIMDQLEGMYEKIPSGRQIGGLRMWLDKFVPTGIRNYETFKLGNLGTIARSISSEVGVLNEKDIERAKGLFPEPTDTKREAEGKLVNLKFLMQERKRILGMPSTRTTPTTLAPEGVSNIKELGTTMGGIQGLGQTQKTPAPQISRGSMVDDIISEIYGLSR